MRSGVILLACMVLMVFGRSSMAQALPRQLSLDDAFRIALRNNPDFRARLAMIEAAGGVAISNRSITFPSLEGQLSGGIQGPRGRSDDRLFGIFNSSFTQPLFNLAIPPSWESGNLLVLSATHNYWVAVNATLHAIRNLYIRIQYEERKRFLIKTGAKIFEDVAAALESGTATGVARQTEVKRALFRAATFDEQLPLLRQQRQLHLNRLAELMGVELPAESNWIETVELTSPALRPPAAQLHYAALVAEARRNRPDLALLYTQADLQHANAKIAFAAQLPIISMEIRQQILPDENSSDTSALEISATGEGGAPTAATLQNENFVQNELRLGPSLEWQIFDGFAAYGQYRASKAQAKAALVNAERLGNDIAIGVKIVKVNLTALNSIIDGLDQALPTAQQTSDFARISLLESQLPTSVLEFEYAVDELQEIGLEIRRLEAVQARALAYSLLDFITGRYLHLDWLDPGIEKRLP